MDGNWFINYEWLKMDEDGLVPPSEAVAAKAVEVANTLQKKGFEAPSRICPDGDGGIVFEWSSNNCLEVVTVESGCNCEWSFFKDGKLMFATVGLPPPRK